MKGNEAIAEAAMRAGCDAYFGYPITPPERAHSLHGQEHARSGAGLHPGRERDRGDEHGLRRRRGGRQGDDLLLEPGRLAEAGGHLLRLRRRSPLRRGQRGQGGPRFGGISPAQGDYFQSTRGGGHGDYHHIVLAPKSVQEAADLTYEAFALAEKWRMPVMILADGLIGQMMEGVVLPARPPFARAARQALGRGGAARRKDRQLNHVSSCILDPRRPRSERPRPLRAL